MANTKKDKVTDPEQLKCFQKNLRAMQKRLLNEPLHNFRRKATRSTSSMEDPKKNRFARELERDYRPAFNAAQDLPAYSALYSYLTGGEVPQDAVVKIADFCTAALAFGEPITDLDLLTREIDFPALRPTVSLKRYEGIYRCFYFYPDLRLEESGGEPQLQGGLLRLKEEEGELRACLITGIRRDEQFSELETLIALSEKPEFFSAFKAYNARLPEHESRLVCYRNQVDMGIAEYLTMHLRRQGEEEHGNVAFLFLRRFDKSAQPKYSGGIAGVTLCRGGNLTSFAMVVVREKLTMAADGAFNARYLAEQSNDGRGLRITEDSEGHWNRAMLERVGQRKAGKR